jgi:AcrR family transcriptional regulator
MATTSSKPRIPAAQRRDALIDAAVEEFAHGGLHATPVDRIARRVGVAQPYVFSLFPTKKDLFIAAVERGFERTMEVFAGASEMTFKGLGDAYVELLMRDRTLLTLQLHAYAAAADDEVIASHVRQAYAGLLEQVRALTGATDDELQEFSAHGMWINVQAAMNLDDLEESCGWIKRRHEESEE